MAFFRWTSACVLCVALPLAAAPVWRVTEPYPGNPLKVVALDGEGRAGGETFAAALEFSCHPEARVPRVQLRLPQSIPGWDLHRYDGAGGGTGQRNRSLTVQAANRRSLDRPRFNGMAGDGGADFLFSWQPSEALLAHLVRGGDGVMVRVAGSRRQGRLALRFTLPADDAAMLSVLSPCSRALGKKAGGHAR